MVYYEATLRPSEFDEEVEIIQKDHEKQGESALPFEVPSDSTVVETVEVQGFRIQVFASSSIDEASAAQIVAREKVGTDSVYVVYDPPVYKVRVGDYATRLEANQRLPRLVHLGYTDAWVVSDKISLRRVTRIPRPAD
ncbi:MAG: SPOR domain-containing protein [Ignavibacteriales bacterium]|nr:SPOR domain-containing protein [Ignavibacteriales bacterium]